MQVQVQVQVQAQVQGKGYSLEGKCVRMLCFASNKMTKAHTRLLNHSPIHSLAHPPTHPRDHSQPPTHRTWLRSFLLATPQSCRLSLGQWVQHFRHRTVPQEEVRPCARRSALGLNVSLGSMGSLGMPVLGLVTCCWLLYILI